MSWKDILKEEEDDFPRHAPRDSSYVSVEEQEQRGQYLFDKRNVGRVYRNKRNGKNYIFNRLYNNGEIELVSQPEEREHNTMREVYQAALDKLKEKDPNDKNTQMAIDRVKYYMSDISDEELDRPIEEEIVLRITPAFALNYDLLPEQ